MNEKEPSKAESSSAESQKGPPGGHDSTPLPSSTGGYTVRLTFHRATNLPMSDLDTLSSDPYLFCELQTDLPQRHKQDGPLRLRTPTVRRSVDPEWNARWVVANIPSSGFKLKVTLSCRATYKANAPADSCYGRRPR
jgi:hypothetical protein